MSRKFRVGPLLGNIVSKGDSWDCGEIDTSGNNVTFVKVSRRRSIGCEAAEVVPIDVELLEFRNPRKSILNKV